MTTSSIYKYPSHKAYPDIDMDLVLYYEPPKNGSNTYNTGEIQPPRACEMRMPPCSMYGM